MAKILYLEDELWQVKNTVITFIERELKHNVTVVTNVTEANRELSTSQYDVVILDIMLDITEGFIQYEESGLIVAKNIIEGKFLEAGNPATIPIIIASGVWDVTVKIKNGGMETTTVADFANALSIPQKYFLSKPFLADEVSNIIKSALMREESTK